MDNENSKDKSFKEKFEIEKEILLNNLKKVSKALKSKNLVPVLSGIKFDLEKEGLRELAVEAGVKGFKINKIKKLMLDKNFCKLILIDNNELIGFISIFPNDCDEEQDLSPWYATMYVKEKHRGKGYSKILNAAIIKEAYNRGFEKLYLKTDLDNYYEKFGAQYIKKLSSGEKLYFIKTK